MSDKYDYFVFLLIFTDDSKPHEHGISGGVILGGILGVCICAVGLTLLLGLIFKQYKSKQSPYRVETYQFSIA